MLLMQLPFERKEEEKDHQILEYLEKKKKKKKKSCTGECWEILHRNYRFCLSKEILKFHRIFFNTGSKSIALKQL